MRPAVDDTAQRHWLGCARRGVSFESACVSAGLEPRKVRGEMRRDPELRLAWNKAVADGEVVLVAKMHDLAQTDHRALAWLLERMNPRRYGKVEAPPEKLSPSEVRKLWGGR